MDCPHILPLPVAKRKTSSWCQPLPVLEPQNGLFFSFLSDLGGRSFLKYWVKDGCVSATLWKAKMLLNASYCISWTSMGSCELADLVLVDSAPCKEAKWDLCIHPEEQSDPGACNTVCTLSEIQEAVVPVRIWVAKAHHQAATEMQCIRQAGRAHVSHQIDIVVLLNTF